MNSLLAVGIYQSWFHFPDGGIWSNLLASLLWTPIAMAAGWFGALRHLHCQEKRCFKIATVPVEGTVHKVCKTHAKQLGHTH